MNVGKRKAPDDAGAPLYGTDDEDPPDSFHDEGASDSSDYSSDDEDDEDAPCAPTDPMPAASTKLPAWDGKTPLMKGVNRGSTCGYDVTLDGNKKHFVISLDAAIAMRKKYDEERAARKASETPEERRKRHKEESGGKSEQERVFAKQLWDAFLSIGWDCLILNDFTLADILVKPADDTSDSWYCVQLKTTKRNCKGRRSWQLRDVTGYDFMLVCCHALKGPNGYPCSWVYDGRVLDKHVPCGNLHVYPQGAWDDRSKKGRLLDRCGPHRFDPHITNKAQAHAACAIDTAKKLARLLVRDNYPRVTENEGRWTFKDYRQFYEYAGLHMLMRLANETPEISTMTTPEEQQPHHDLVETCTATGKTKRLQAKSARPRWRLSDGTPTPARSNLSGVEVTIEKQCGSKVRKAYDPKDFDVLVVVWRDVLCDCWRVWRIPVEQIPIQKDGKLVTTLRVHVPRNARLPPGVDRNEAHGPEPNLLVDGKRVGKGGISKTYDWTSKLCETYPMRDAWEPPFPWPKELAHLRRRPRASPASTEVTCTKIPDSPVDAWELRCPEGYRLELMQVGPGRKLLLKLPI